jgi:hypothetical protein
VRILWKNYQKNKKRVREVQIKYLKNPQNRIKRNDYIRAYKQKRRSNDPSYRLYENARKRVWKILKASKSNSTHELIGCSKQHYTMWITYTMKNDMNWDNYGNAEESIWNIDHVKAIDNYKLENKSELFEAFNWRNTRASYCSDNFSKKNKISIEDEQKQKKDLQLFDKIIKFKQNLKLAIRSQVDPERGQKVQRLD